MNSLSNYFAAAKLAKMLLIQAEDNAGRGKLDKAVRDMVMAIREMLVAQNNVAAIAFKSRRRGTK